MVAIEKVHPLQSGVVRIKHRKDRRPTKPIEPIWQFYPKFAAEFVTKALQFARLWLWIDRLRRQIRKDPNRHAYVDTAIAPIEADDAGSLQLLTHSKAAQAAVEHARKIRELTAPAARSIA